MPSHRTTTLALASLSVLGCSRDLTPEARAQNVPPTAVPGAPAQPAATPPPAQPAADAGVAQAPRRGPPADLNVVLITIDSLRADMPWSGYPRPIAPRLTALESRAVSYTQAYALSSYTSMSVGGFLGGRLPGELRRDGYFFGTYPNSNVMFPEKLQAAGVRTLAAHAHGYFRRGKAGFEQGFDVWQLLPGLHWNATTDVDVTGDRHAETARRLLGDPANTAGRFFAWFHFMDPHDQYQGHPGVTPWGRRNRDRYDGEVTWTDRHVGELVDWIQQQPWGARTAIVVSADHGEAFGEHGEYRHGFYLYQELVRVPWFFVVPGATPRRIEAPRSHLDMAPTILELMGVAPEPSFTGRSLVGELYGAAPEARDVIVDLPRTSDNDRRRALVHGHHKVIASGDDARFEVFDLAADPGETRNLRQTDRATYDAMVARYRAAQGAIRDVNPYRCRTLQGAPPGRDH